MVATTNNLFKLPNGIEIDVMKNRCDEDRCGTGTTRSDTQFNLTEFTIIIDTRTEKYIHFSTS